MHQPRLQKVTVILMAGNGVRGDDFIRAIRDWQPEFPVLQLKQITFAFSCNLSFSLNLCIVHCGRDGNKWASKESLFESWGRNACLPDFMLWKILSCNCKRRNVSKRLGQLWQVTMNSRQHLVAGARHFAKVLFTKNHLLLMWACESNGFKVLSNTNHWKYYFPRFPKKCL